MWLHIYIEDWRQHYETSSNLTTRCSHLFSTDTRTLLFPTHQLVRSVKWQCQQIAGGIAAFKHQTSLAWGQQHQPCCYWSLKVFTPGAPLFLGSFLSSQQEVGERVRINLWVISIATEDLPNQVSSGNFFLSSNTLRAKKSYRPTSTAPPPPSHSQTLCWSGCLSSAVVTQCWDKPAAQELLPPGLVSQESLYPLYRRPT